jgi:hypothetical protein
MLDRSEYNSIPRYLPNSPVYRGDKHQQAFSRALSFIDIVPFKSRHY